jgi:hypothetical protein
MGMTGHQGMLTSPRYLIPPQVFPGVFVSLLITVDCSNYMYMNWALIFTVEFSVYLSKHSGLDSLFFRFPNLDMMNLATDFEFEMEAQSGCDRLAEDALTPPRYLIPPLVFSGVRVCRIFRIYISCRICETDYYSLYYPFTSSTIEAVVLHAHLCFIMLKSSLFIA